MAVDVQNLKPPSEEEIRWAQRIAEEEDDDFPGDSGIVAYRMRLRREAEARQHKFDAMRIRLRKVSHPSAKAA
jgi:hypothetical protein